MDRGGKRRQRLVRVPVLAARRQRVVAGPGLQSAIGINLDAHRQRGRQPRASSVGAPRWIDGPVRRLARRRRNRDRRVDDGADGEPCGRCHLPGRGRHDDHLDGRRRRTAWRRVSVLAARRFGLDDGPRLSDRCGLLVAAGSGGLRRTYRASVGARSGIVRTLRGLDRLRQLRCPRGAAGVVLRDPGPGRRVLSARGLVPRPRLPRGSGGPNAGRHRLTAHGVDQVGIWDTDRLPDTATLPANSLETNIAHPDIEALHLPNLERVDRFRIDVAIPADPADEGAADRNEAPMRRTSTSSSRPSAITGCSSSTRVT